VLLDAFIELPRDPADHLLVTDVGLPEPARRQTADPATGLDDDDAATLSAHLHGGGDPR
jgi:hypothetical protein